MKADPCHDRIVLVMSQRSPSRQIVICRGEKSMIMQSISKGVTGNFLRFQCFVEGDDGFLWPTQVERCIFRIVFCEWES